MPAEHDLLVLGTGAAAQTAAYRCSEAGWGVAVVDSRPYGGTCALRGCDPKKVLVGATGLVQQARRMQDAGVQAEDLAIDWPSLMRHKRTFTRPVPKQREEAFHEAGIETLHGRARFVDEREVDVDGQRIRADKILLATGAKPRELDLPGSELLATSDVFLDIDELPEQAAFVGGGYVSFELAHLVARAGSKARIYHRSERVLGAFDADLVDELVEAGRQEGIEVHTEAPVREIEDTGEGVRVYTDGDQPAREHDIAVHGAGRVPEIDDLDLQAGGIEHSEDGIEVDEHLRSTSNEHVYAAGDAADTDGWPLTPVAGMESRVAAANLLAEESGEELEEPDYTGTASVVFTIPPLARVGMSQAEAEEAEDAGEADVRVEQGEMTDWFSYARLRHEPAAYKVLVDDETDLILGAHILGVHAEETINLFALAIRQAIPADELREVPFSYPSHGSDLPYML